MVVRFVFAGALLLAHDYQHPDQAEWYARLMMPDNPMVSCCGSKEAYWADKVDECRPGDVVYPWSLPCFMVAIITDERDIPGRYNYPVGTRVAIPKNKIRKNPSYNPTDHNVLFIGPQTKQVFCWEPMALL